MSGAAVDGLLRFVDMAQKDGQSVEQGLQLAIQAALVSPNFLFHMERETSGRQAQQVSEIELASRLSYFLWSSMPDDELLSLAEAGRLRTSLDHQVDRMLADPRSGNTQPGRRQTRSGEVPGMEPRAARCHETRNVDVFRVRAAGEPSYLGFS